MKEYTIKYKKVKKTKMVGLPLPFANQHSVTLPKAFDFLL